MSHHFTRVFSNLTYSKSTYGVNFQKTFHLLHINKRPQLKVQTSSTSFRCFGKGISSFTDRDDTYISRYYQPKPGEVLEFLNRNYKFPITADTKDVLVVKCTKCRKKQKRYSLKIDVNHGTFQCTECLYQGVWGDYVHSVTRSNEFQIMTTSQLGFKSEERFTKSEEEIGRYPSNLQNDKGIIDKFEAQGIKKETLIAYNVGISEYDDPESGITPKQTKCLTFPRMTPEFNNEPCNNVLKTKVARIKACKASSIENLDFVTFDPHEFVPGLFGYHLAKLKDDIVILTGNENDAMAAYQETEIPALCLPNQNQLPPQVLPLLERFSKIFLWFDDDVNGRDCAEKFAQKLGIDRCLIVNTRCNDFFGPVNAHQALKQGRDLNEFLDLAKPLQHEQILNFDSLRDAIYREITNPNQVSGVLCRDLPGLNKIMKIGRAHV